MAGSMRERVLWRRGRWLWRVVVIVALCAIILAVGTVVVVRDRANGPTEASATAGGLTYTLQFSPGPYFLREFTIAQLTLTNQSHTTYQTAGDCGEALSLNLTGSGGPTYALPFPDTSTWCPGPIPRPFAPGQVLRETIYLPLTVSGDATLTAHVSLGSFTTDAKGITYLNTSDGPFTGHSPALHLSIAPTVPADRTLSLSQTTEDGAPVVTAGGSPAIQGNIYELDDLACGDPTGHGEITDGGPIGWDRLYGMSIGEPGCPGPNEVWAYAFAAPGYAIATGIAPLGARLLERTSSSGHLTIMRYASSCPRHPPSAALRARST